MDPETLTGDVEATLQIESLELVEGTYKADVAVHKRDGFPYMNEGCPSASRRVTSVISTSRDPHRPSVA